MSTYDTPNTVISGTAAADNITNAIGADRVTIDAKGGHDDITNLGAYVSINAGAGNDTVYNTSNTEYDKVTGEYLGNVGGDHTTIRGGAGNDSIKNNASLVAAYGDEGDDILIHGFHSEKSNQRATLVGGKGNDTIELTGLDHYALVQYTEGDGNDVILGMGENDTLQLLDGAEITGGYIGNNGSDLILEVGSGSLTIKKGVGKSLNISTDEDFFEGEFSPIQVSNDADDEVITGTDLNDTIENYGNSVRVRAGKGADNIVNEGATVTIDAAEGNDYVYNNGTRVTINGGAGDDTIKNDGDRVTINGGDGSDRIENEGNRVSINGGAGDDYIENYGSLATIVGGAGDDTINVGVDAQIRYANGDGNDVILGYDESSTIRITSGSISSVVADGLDVILQVGDGSLTLKDAVGKIITTVDSNGKVTTIEGGQFDLTNNESGVSFNGNSSANKMLNLGDLVTVNAGGGNDIVQNEGANVSISGGAGADLIVDKSRGVTTINGGAGNDTLQFDTAGAHLIEYGAGNDVVIGYTENDTIKILNSAIDIYDDIASTVVGDDLVFTIDGGTLTIKDAKSTKITFLSAGGDVISDYFGPLNTNNSGGASRINGTAYDDTIRNWAGEVNILGNAGNDYIENEGELSTLRGGAGADTIINSGAYSSIDGGAGNDYIENTGAQSTLNGGDGDDHIVNLGRRSTIVGGKGNDYIEGSEDYPEVFVFNATDGNDIIENFGAGDSLRMSGTIADSVKTDEGDLVITLTSGGGSNVGIVTLRDVGSKNVVVSNNTLTLKTATSNDTDYAENFDDNVNFTVPDDGKNYYMLNTGNKVTVRAGEGNDTIEGSDLYGELFTFGADAGNNVIVNFGQNDTIYSANALSADTVGDDIIVTLENGGLSSVVTLQGAAALAEANGFAFIQNNHYLVAGTPETLTHRTSDDKFNGTDKAEYLVNNGGTGVTLDGKGGNDTIIGNDEAEVILFSAIAGNDVVTNFGDNDSLKVTYGQIQSHKVEGKDYVVYVSDGNKSNSIVLKDAAEKQFIQSGSVLYVDDVITTINTQDNTEFNGSAGRERMINSGANVTIKPSAGDDTVSGSDLFGDIFEFSNGDGNNVITNFKANDTIYSSGSNISGKVVGDNYVVTIGSTVVTLKGVGGLNFKPNGKYLTVDDIVPIENPSSNKNSLVGGTGGRDSIVNYAENVTIDPGAGDDTMTGSDAYGEVFKLSSAYDNNVITNFSKNDTIYMSAGKNMSWAADGNDVVVTLKGTSYTGTVRLIDAAKNGYELNPSKLKSTDKNDNVLTVNGVDTVHVTKAGKFNGTAKTEYIMNDGVRATIDGKGGDDTIVAANEPEMFNFSSAYGQNSAIIDFGADDTLRMTAGKTLSFATVGSDVVVTLKGNAYTGYVTLQDAAGMNFAKSANGSYLYVENPEPTINHNDSITWSGTAKAEYMINYDGEGVTIDGKSGKDTLEGAEAYGDVFIGSAAYDDMIITNFGDNDTLRSSSGTITSFAADGDDMIVTLKGSQNRSSVITLQGAADKDFVLKSGALVVDYVAPIENSRDNVKVEGTDGKDYIFNTGMGATIDPGTGNDTIEGSDLYGDIFQLSSAYDNNVITNFGDNDTLYMSAGKTITFATVGADVVVTLKGNTYTGYETLLGAAGKNFISNGKYLVVDTGYNPILNRKSDTLISGTNNADLIENISGSNVTIKPNGGNDTIIGNNFYKEMFLIGALDGNNVIKDFGAGDTLKISDGAIDAAKKNGDDYIVSIKKNNYMSYVTIEGAGEAEWSESSDKKSLTIYPRTNIINRLDNRTVEGTEGADVITNTGDKATIQAMTGNDTITGSDTFGDIFQLSSADGNNIITNFGVNDTLQMTAGKTISTQVSGDDVIVTLKGTSYTGVETLLGAAGLPFKVSNKKLYVDGVKTITNSANKKSIPTTDGRDYVVNTGSGVTIVGSKGDDTIEGSDAYGEMFSWSSAYGDDVIVNFHSNDTLYMASGKNMTWSTVDNDVVVTLKGTAFTGTVTLKDAADLNFKKSSNGKYLTATGISTIENNVDNKKVVGTDGDDYIFNYAMNASIEGKAGNDTIEGSSFAETFLLSSADGKNVITNFGANDTLTMTAGKTITFKEVGDDVLVTLKGNAYTGYETLQGAAGLNFKKSKDGKSLYVDGVTTTVNHDDGKKISGTDGRNYIYNFGANVTIEGKGGDDTIEGSDLYGELINFNSSDGNDVIVNFGNDDTLKVINGTVKSYAAEGNDYVVTVKGSNNTTGTVRLIDAVSSDKILKWTDAKTLRLRTVVQSGSGAEMPAPEDGYWFIDEEAATNELDQIVGTESDNAIGKLALDDPLDPLTAFGDSARNNQLTTGFARHQKKK